MRTFGTAGADCNSPAKRTPAAACLPAFRAALPAVRPDGKAEIMANELLRIGLQRLQNRLSSVVKPDSPLQCWIIEWRNMRARPQSDSGLVPGLSDYTVVWDSVDSRDVGCELDGNDNDSDDREHFWELHLSTLWEESPTWDESLDRLRSIFDKTLQPIFVEAGNLLPRILADVLPIPVSSATRETDDSLERWLYFVFDLAWAKIPESPLRASMDKDYHWLPAIKRFTPDIHGNYPEPDCRCSIIDDVVQASLYAIDFLLTMETDSQNMAENNAKPTTRTEKGEGNGAGESDAKPVAASDQVKLFGPGEQPIVNNNKVAILTEARYDVVQTLLEAGESGLSKDDLDKKSGHSTAHKLLKAVAKSSPEWAKVIQLPGKGGMGKHYRIL
jgi:hypothetical protein